MPRDLALGSSVACLDAGDMGLPDPVVGSYFASGTRVFKDGLDVILAKPSVPVFLSKGISEFGYRVSVVVGPCAQTKMIRSNAGWNVACVHDDQMLWDRHTVPVLVGIPMRPDLLGLVYGDDSIAEGILASSPEPASRTFEDTTLEDISQSKFPEISKFSLAAKSVVTGLAQSPSGGWLASTLNTGDGSLGLDGHEPKYMPLP